ncbi:MAG: sensor histidine kinase [Bacteroidales bacterium]|nr:sensor histidine kinase [Bacteroidales bacterium]
MIKTVFFQWKSGRAILLFFFLSALLLSVCFCSFGIIAGKGGFPWRTIFLNLVGNVPAFLLMAGLDYLILTRPLPHRDIPEWFILRLLAATLSAPLLLCLIVYIAWVMFPFQFDFLSSIIPGTLCNAIIVLLISIYLYDKRQMESRQRLALMEREKIRYQFEALKNQINPHFLFNSLNVLASLAYQDADKTNLFVKKLAEVYRYLLTTHDRQTVSLAEELRFTEAYLYLENIRFGEVLQVCISGNCDTQSCFAIIPASLQMLVENAIKHNIATTKSPLIIRITIGQEGITVSNNLQLRSYVGAKNGMGLVNLRNQYALHGKELTVRKTEKEFVVEIPFIS